MRIAEIRTMAGPNVYSHRPVLRLKLYLDDLTDRESREFAGLNERLLALLPGLEDHHCSKDYPGGFVERLREGTYFGHVVEHVGLELMTLCDIEVSHGKTRQAGEPGCYYVVVEYKAEQGARYLLQEAVALVEALLKDQPYLLAETLVQARRLIAQTELGPSTKAIVEAAARRGIPWQRLDEHSLVQLGYGRHSRFIKAAMTDRTKAICVDVASDKEMTKTRLRCAAIPVPRGEVVKTAEQAVAALAELGAPVAVKPLDGQQGRGVSLNLTTPAQVAEAFQIAKRHAEDVLVEELFHGRDYRVLVVNGEIVAASERIPAQVVGDGEHTIAELIELANQDPRRGEGHARALTRLEVDPIVTACLEKHGRALGDVPRVGERVLLRECANLSTGGTARDVTDELHPEVAEICQLAAQLAGLDICGIDLILDDIAEPPGESNGILEVNASPGLRMHLAPSEGQPRDVGAPIIEMLYPQGTPARVPIFAITGTNGKTTITRLIGHTLQSAGQAVGMTTTDGTYLNGKRLSQGDTTGPRSARDILSNPVVEVAVLETARGGIVRGGLGYDWADVAVLSNIRVDHFGQDGIETLDDLLWIKSLVAERVREGGTLVLNADDKLLARLPESPRVSRVRKNIVWFSLHAPGELLRRHLSAGGRAYFPRDGWLIEAEGGREMPLVRAAEIPLTFNGTAKFQIANALAAAAACRAHGLPRKTIIDALLTFSNCADNAGRANLYRVADGYLLLDYGHNPDAFEAVCQTVAHWRGRRVTGVIGVPGDRTDAVIEQAGRTAARSFDRLLIREDKDLRGRRRGAVAELLRRGAQREAPERACRVVLDEAEALRTALAEIRADEVVVLFYEKLEPLAAVLRECGAVPTDTIPVLNLPTTAARHVQRREAPVSLA